MHDLLRGRAVTAVCPLEDVHTADFAANALSEHWCSSDAAGDPH